MKLNKIEKMTIASLIAIAGLFAYKDFHDRTIASFSPEAKAALEDLDATYCDFLLKAEKFEKLKETCGDWELSR